jgi:hypothetical protein
MDVSCPEAAHSNTTTATEHARIEPKKVLSTKHLVLPGSFSRERQLFRSRHARERMPARISLEIKIKDMERVADQIRRTNRPGGPLSRVMAVSKVLPLLTGKRNWIVPAAGGCSAGRGEEILVSKTEG